MMWWTLWRRLAGLAGVAGMAVLLGASPAIGQSMRITAPADGTEVAAGGTVLVRGEGCEPGSTVIFAYEDPGPKTTATDDGTFAAHVPVPDINVPEGRLELELTATCGGSSDTVLLVIEDDNPTPPSSGGRGQVRQVPKGGVQTGAGGTASQPTAAVWSAAGALAILGLTAALVAQRSAQR